MRNEQQDQKQYPYYNHDSKVWAPRVLLFGKGLVGVLAILWGCSQIPEGNEDQFWNVFILGSVTWLILLTAWEQISVNRKQWQVMQSQEERMIEQRDLMKGQLDVMHKAQDSFLISERAYLAPKKLKLVNKPLEAGKQPETAFLIVNGGKTPAFNVTCGHETAVSERSFDAIADEMIEKLNKSQITFTSAYILGGDYTLGVTSKMVIPDDAFLSAWNDRKARYYWLMRLGYTDIAGNRHTVSFWFEYRSRIGDGGAWIALRTSEHVLKAEPEHLTLTPQGVSFTVTRISPKPD